MSEKNVLLLGNEKLRKESSQVSDLYGKETRQIKKDLKDTLEGLKDEHGMGRALAAPQIGYHKQIIYYDYEGRSFYMINPEITAKSSGKLHVWDSCFSFNLAFFVRIPRRKSIEVEYLDEGGEKQEEKAEKDESELFQHEIDHLNGKLATDYLGSPGNIIMREEWEKNFR